MSPYRFPAPREPFGGHTVWDWFRRRGRKTVVWARRRGRKTVVWWHGSWRERRYRCHCGQTWPKRGKLYPFWAAKVRNRKGCPGCTPIPKEAYHPEMCLLCRYPTPWRGGNHPRVFFCAPCYHEIEYRRNPTDLIRLMRGSGPPGIHFFRG